MHTNRYDPSKLVISAGNTGLTGRDLSRILLEKYHLQMEMSAGGYALAMTSVGDTPEGFRRLSCALKEIDGSYPSEERNWKEDVKVHREEKAAGDLRKRKNIPCLPPPDMVYNSSEIQEMDCPVESRHWRDCAGYVSVEYAYLYPPGIPFIVPGERVSQEAVNVLQWYYEMGFSIEGLKRDSYIEVLTHG